MIKPIAEYTALVGAKARMSPARYALQFRPERLIEHAQNVVESTNRAIGEVRAQITTAIDGLVPGDHGPSTAIIARLNARHAFAAIEVHAGIIAELDLMLTAAATLPADVDVDDEVARLRAEREVHAADLTRDTAVLVHALADARLDVTDEAPAAAEQRCPECGTIAPGHSTVHDRYPEGGGGVNRPCSRSNGANA
jgi:hypothetical protein